MQTTDYPLLLAQADALTNDEPNTLANLANVSALLFDQLTDINWCGFYFLRDDELVLGPFQGKSACTRIGWNQGVCGTAAAMDQTLRIANVHEFDGHIACDAASESEIVIPLHVDGRVAGVLDIDSPIIDRFSAADQVGLEAIAQLIESGLANDTQSIGLFNP
ncbi:MAG: GAF domain-containing protein [Woeseiaceae bacterium]